MGTVMDRPMSREFEGSIDYSVLNPANIGRMMGDEEGSLQVITAATDIVQQVIDHGLDEDLRDLSGLSECESRNADLSEDDARYQQFEQIIGDLEFLPDLIREENDEESRALLAEDVTVALIDTLMLHVRPHEFAKPAEESAKDKIIGEKLQKEALSMELSRDEIGWLSAEKTNPERVSLVVDTTQSGRSFAWANIISLAPRTRKLFDKIDRSEQPEVLERTLEKIAAAIEAGESPDKPAYSKGTIQFEGNFAHTKLPVYKARGILRDIRVIVLGGGEESGKKKMPVFLVAAGYRKTKTETEQYEIYGNKDPKSSLLGGKA